jgi:hypothetical protein
LKQERTRLEARLEAQLEEERQALLEKKRKVGSGAGGGIELSPGQLVKGWQLCECVFFCGACADPTRVACKQQQE